jgi:hypothetical protein
VSSPDSVGGRPSTGISPTEESGRAPRGQPLATFLGLSTADRFLLLRAAVWLAIARMGVLLLPFRTLSRHLGEPLAESPQQDDPAHGDTLCHIAWAIQAVGHRTPWRSKCLEQAIAGKMLLRARGIPNTLYFGVARDDGAGIEAHAWLRSGSHFLTGGAQRERFTVVSQFADGTTAR